MRNARPETQELLSNARVGCATRLQHADCSPWTVGDIVLLDVSVVMLLWRTRDARTWVPREFILQQCNVPGGTTNTTVVVRVPGLLLRGSW